MGKFGCLLIVIAVMAMIAFVVIPVLPPFAENETIDGFLTPLVCQSGETIERSQYSGPARDGGTSYSMDVYCHDKQGHRRDETGRWVLLGMGAFVVPFLIGLFMVIGASNRNTTRLVTRATSNVPMSTPFSTSSFVVPANKDKSLSDRLKQIDEAKNQGLITAEEYDRLRKEILDDMK